MRQTTSDISRVVSWWRQGMPPPDAKVRDRARNMIESFFPIIHRKTNGFSFAESIPDTRAFQATVALVG